MELAACHPFEVAPRFLKICVPLRYRTRFKTAIYLRNVNVNSLLVIKGPVKCSGPVTRDNSISVSC